MRKSTPVVALLGLGIALGVARRALDEVTVQAIEKSRGLPPSLLVTQAQFQFSLGKAELELASAHALAIAVMSPRGSKRRRDRYRRQPCRPRCGPRPVTLPRWHSA